MTPLVLLAQVIKSEMGLADDQVYLWDQQFAPPKDQRLYITVGILSARPFANSKQFVTIDDVLNEQLSTNIVATVSLDLMSRGTDARDRKEEVVLALKSTYSEQIQQANGFYIAPHTGVFTNLSSVEGPAIPYRFNATVNIQYNVIKTKAVPYYDSFQLDTVLLDP